MFYQKLIENRKNLELSQEELAYKIGVNKSVIKKWESGISMPDIEALIKLADLFHVSTDYLLKDSKSNSDFSYYTIHDTEKKEQLSPFKLVSILAVAIASLSLLTLLVATIVEPVSYMLPSGKVIDGFIAYCYQYWEFLALVIFLFVVLILGILTIFIPDEKRKGLFHKKS